MKKTNINTNSLATKFAAEAFKWGVPLLIGAAIFKYQKSKLFKLFTPKPKTNKELAVENSIKHNISGFVVMDRHLDETGKVSALQYQIWKNQHPENEALLKTVFTPYRKLKDQFLFAVNNHIIDRAFITAQGLPIHD